jgi:hypothetical protein
VVNQNVKLEPMESMATMGEANRSKFHAIERANEG